MARKVKATFEFWAENDAELSLQIGDIVTILNSDDPGWWEGELNGQRGLFPSNYVEPFVAPAKFVPAAPAKAAPVGAKKPPGPPGPPAKAAATVSVQFGAPAGRPAGAPLAQGGASAPTARAASPAPSHGEVKRPLDRKDTGMKPGPSLTGGKYKQSKTKWGVWSSNQAVITGWFSIFMGAGAILWAGADPGVVVPGTAGTVYAVDKVKQFYRIVCGCYAIVVGVATLVFERYLGNRRGPIRFPIRGLVYLGVSIFLFYSEPTMTIGGFYLCVGITNTVAAILGEEYDAPPKVEVQKVEEKALESDSTWDALVQVAVMFKEQNKIGVMCFMVFYVCANVGLFGYTVTVWIAKNNALATKTPGSELSGWGPYAKGFGKLLDLNCSLVLLPVCRTMIRGIYNLSTRDQSCTSVCLRNIFAFMPLDRNLSFHKLVAKVTLAVAIGHTIMHFINFALAPVQTLAIFAIWPWITGGIICMSMLLIYSAAYDNTKRGQFEIFWYNHHFFVVFFGFILTHGHAYWNVGFYPYFLGPGILYIIERILRYMRARQPVVIGSVTMMKPCVYSLEFIKEGSVWEGNDYKEGQYLFLQAPHISRVQWHPFTISSAPQEKTVTVHIRVSDEDSWTYQLMKSFEQMGPGHSYFKLDRQGANGKVPGKILGPWGEPMLRIDGPHSAPTQHIGEYTNAMIIGAGIGVTPVAATMKSVVFHRWKYSIGHAFPDHAYFYWVCGYGDIDAFRWFIKVIKDAQDEVTHMRATQAASMSTKTFEVHIWITSVPKDCKPIDFVVDDEIGFWGVPREDDKVDKHRCNFTEEDIYRVMKCPAKHTQLDDVHIYAGRPDWNPRFDAVAKQQPQGDVGVCFCGNPMIAKDLAKACHKASHGREKGIFVLHKENF